MELNHFAWHVKTVANIFSTAQAPCVHWTMPRDFLSWHLINPEPFLVRPWDKSLASCMMYSAPTNSTNPSMCKKGGGYTGKTSCFTIDRASVQKKHL